jgi:hypothetical protein
VAMFSVGVVRDWRYTPFVDAQFPSYVARFERLAPGQSLDIPITPPGWSMTLRKRAQSPLFSAATSTGARLDVRLPNRPRKP